eukprot:5297134-Pyramimonas_sp.AAC.1
MPPPLPLRDSRRACPVGSAWVDAFIQRRTRRLVAEWWRVLDPRVVALPAQAAGAAGDSDGAAACRIGRLVFQWARTDVSACGRDDDSLPRYDQHGQTTLWPTWIKQ